MSVLLGGTEQILYVAVEGLGYFQQGFELGLGGVGAPLGNGGGVFAKCLGQPFAGLVLLDEDDFDAVYFFAFPR